VPSSMHICPESLAAAAVQAGQYSDDLFASHARVDATVESALSGWVGSSAVALATRAASWAIATTVLSTTVREQADALRQSALQFAEMDRRNAAVLARIGPGDRPL